MSEEEIRGYLSRRKDVAPPSPRPVVVRRRPTRQPPKEATFEEFSASHLFCNTCGAAMPVRQRLMLYLPDGNLYDYRCEGCDSSLGTRKG